MLQSIDPNTLCMGCMTTAVTGSFCQECGWPQAKDNHTCQLPIRTILAGKYLVGRVLGQGGFGITYLGWDLNLDMKVAIKEYYPESLVSREQTGRTLVQCFAGESQQFFAAGREKFVQEAKMLAKFDDLPGVVSVKDFFMENGTAYIVMKFIQGETLKKHIADEGRLPAADVLNRLYPLMVSLSQIHASGLIHRDISPDNIILEPDGGVKLLDFGAARSMSLTGEHSSTINVKKGYAPPEQYRVHGEQGPWTDVYALAATVYKAITGKTPPQSLDREVKDFLQHPTELGAELNWWQEAAILKGMSPRIESRYPSVAAFVADLYSAEAPAGMVQPAAGQTPAAPQPPVQPGAPSYSYNPSQQPQGQQGY
ncbi:MAG: serine/threonine protein kinase, partial [Clostridia bacterium]|nr:serine/threonine protein kinase [Clostridia bacterium]